MSKPLLLEDFANRHAGEIAYVLGSGHTVSFYDPDFFADKLTIAVNQGFQNWLPRVTYAVSKYHDIEKYIDKNRCDQIVISAGHTGQLEDVWQPKEDVLVFRHDANKTADFTAADWPEESKLVVSYSTITSAMHFAAHIGSSAIIMVGADCGWLDDAGAVPGHPDSISEPEKNNYPKYFDLQNRIVANEIRRRYKIPVMSMLPFVTPNMEGHRFVSPFGGLNID